MPPAPHLLQLVIQQYPVLGVNSQGSFIGTDKYKQRLIRAFPTYTELQVKQAVNHLSKTSQLPPASSAHPTGAQPQQQQQQQSSAQTLAEWIRSTYPSCCKGPDGALLSRVKIVKILFTMLPPHLKGGTTIFALNDAVREMCLEGVKGGPSPEFPAAYNSTDGARPQALVGWVRSVYPLHGIAPNGDSLGKEAILNKLLKLIPPHTRPKKDDLRSAIQTVLNEVTATAHANGANVYTTSGGIAQSSTTQVPGPGNTEKPRGLGGQLRNYELRLSGGLASSGWVARPLATPHDQVGLAQDTNGLGFNANPRAITPGMPLPEKPIHRNAKIAAALDVHEEDEQKEPQEIPLLDDQMCLLDTSIHDQDRKPSDLPDSDIKNSVLFTVDIIEANKKILPQYGLLGEVFTNGTQSIADSRLFLNTNHPFSVFCCGLQGAGKSHSLSCLLENCLLPTRTLGILKRPLSALVFHFSQYTSRFNFRPCEAAFIACPDLKFKDQHSAVPVTVLVSPSNYAGLKIAYSEIPGVTVKPLLLRPQDLNVGSMLTLMSVNQSSSAPLYISHVTKILREMASQTNSFNFKEFKYRLDQVDMMPLQRKPLEQRIDLLESFLDLRGTNDGFEFPEGSITIVDLSCPFVDENTACVLFNICLGVFLQDSTPGVGKVIAVDEAHKYITDTPASKVLTESLLQLIRQQRHYGARIIISTQEPTIDPRLMDLCSLTLIHRFTSPEWFKTLCKHVSVMEDDAKLFKRIINLRVGEGLIFCPSAIIPSAFLSESPFASEMSYGYDGEDSGSGSSATQEKLGGRFLRVKIRKRLTADGGKSIVSV